MTFLFTYYSALVGQSEGNPEKHLPFNRHRFLNCLIRFLSEQDLLADSEERIRNTTERAKSLNII